MDRRSFIGSMLAALSLPFVPNVVEAEDVIPVKKEATKTLLCVDNVPDIFQQFSDLSYQIGPEKAALKLFGNPIDSWKNYDPSWMDMGDDWYRPWMTFEINGEECCLSWFEKSAKTPTERFPFNTTKINEKEYSCLQSDINYYKPSSYIPTTGSKVKRNV